ncbi:MAG: transglycosylase domain-containing protein [Mogibacterium sp.]|nr:transglycosylase domain-containing protein [Mogibacterium sp.]
MHKTARRMLKERLLRRYLDAVRMQGKHYAPIRSIPPEVLEIFVAREDPRFYQHKGVLPKAVLRAFRYSIRAHVPMPAAAPSRSSCSHVSIIL